MHVMHPTVAEVIVVFKGDRGAPGGPTDFLPPTGDNRIPDEITTAAITNHRGAIFTD